MGIEACQKLCPGVPQVAVFDTAFHQTMPKYVYLYAIPYEYYEKYGVRRYGFHGTSHQYVANRAADILGKPLKDLKMITAHLGNGCSITAIQHGKSQETSMGLTPLNGLMMGQRSGDIDPAIVPFMAEMEKTDAEGVVNVLNKKSGLLGVSGVSSRHARRGEGHGGGQRARRHRPQDVLPPHQEVHRHLRRGHGRPGRPRLHGGHRRERRPRPRGRLLGHGVPRHRDRHQAQRQQGPRERIISSDKSKVTVMVVPTNEELMIARETIRLVEPTTRRRKRKNSRSGIWIFGKRS